MARKPRPPSWAPRKGAAMRSGVPVARAAAWKHPPPGQLLDKHGGLTVETVELTSTSGVPAPRKRWSYVAPVQTPEVPTSVSWARVAPLPKEPLEYRVARWVVEGHQKAIDTALGPTRTAAEGEVAAVWTPPASPATVRFGKLLAQARKDMGG